jgi:hypothetical protein
MPQAPTAHAGELPLDGTPLSALAGYIGNWEIDTEWSDGSRLWGRNEFTVGLAGQFINIDTYARDGDGDKYQRYFSVYSADAETGELTAYGFNFDGTVTIVDDIELTGDVADATLTTRWSAGDSDIRQTIQLVSKDEYTWKVWSGSGDEWELIMDGTWKRVD